MTLSGGTLAANASCTVSVNVTGTTGGTKNNTSGAITSTEGGTGGTASASLTVQAADLTVTKSHSGNFRQGDTGDTYTITVNNLGPGPTVGTVTVVDTLPTGLTATAISGTGWSCVLGTLTCTRSDTLAGGAGYPAVTLTVNVANNAAASVTNTVAVSGGGELNTANDTASDVTAIIQAPDLSISKTHSGSFTQGQSGAVYTLLVSNVGFGPTAGAVTVTDALPAALAATAISGSGWTCALATLTCTRSDALAPGASYPAITLTVNVAANAPSSVTNTAAASGGGGLRSSRALVLDVTTITAAAGPAVIGLNPTLLQFATAVGSNPAPQTFQVQNLASGALGWTATVQTDSGGGWLSVSPTTGVAPSTVTVTIAAAGLARGTYTGRVIITALPSANATNSPQTVEVQLAVGAPLINNNGIVSAASLAPDNAESPGTIVALFGQQLAAGTASAGAIPLPLTLAGTQVLVNATPAPSSASALALPAPLFFVSPMQINFQMLFEVSGTTVTVVVVAGGVQSLPVTLNLVAATPGIFSTSSNGTGQAAVINGDGTPNSANNPAAANSSVSIYATGLGILIPPLASGQSGGFPPNLNATVLTPVVLIGGAQATVLFSGAAPGFVGLDQVNVIIPAGAPAGSAVTLQIQTGGRSSQTVTIAVK